MVPLSRADLHQPQLALQGQVLPLAPGDLQPQGGEAIVNELADLGHRRVSQHLHDGHQLGVEVRITRHPAASILPNRDSDKSPSCGPLKGDEY